MKRTARVVSSCLALVVGITNLPAQDGGAATIADGTVAVLVATRDGGGGTCAVAAKQTLRFAVGDAEREVPLGSVLSLHRGTPASAHEQEVLARDLPLLAAADRQQAAVATEELLAIGLPVVTPLLQSFADTDAHEPDSRYRLFARLLPAGADRKDRTLDMLRLADGTVLRGRLLTDRLAIDAKCGGGVAAELRTLAVARRRVTRTFELQALHDCTYVDWVTTGIVPQAGTTVRADAEGFVRLSFDEDGWATGPDGLFETLPGKRKLQEGFRWGCVLYRVGAAGPRRYAGSHLEAKIEDAPGLLEFVVNDNEHWQNNLGAFRVTLAVDDAFDVGPLH